MGLKGKMGVYGRSIGGIPTTHLADKVDMIIADRTLSNFDMLSKRKFHSAITKLIFKVGSFGWQIFNE